MRTVLAVAVSSYARILEQEPNASLATTEGKSAAAQYQFVAQQMGVLLRAPKKLVSCFSSMVPTFVILRKISPLCYQKEVLLLPHATSARKCRRNPRPFGYSYTNCTSYISSL